MLPQTAAQPEEGLSPTLPSALPLPRLCNPKKTGSKAVAQS